MVPAHGLLRRRKRAGVRISPAAASVTITGRTPVKAHSQSSPLLAQSGPKRTAASGPKRTFALLRFRERGRSIANGGMASSEPMGAGRVRGQDPLT